MGLAFRHFSFHRFVRMGGCLLPSLFLWLAAASADTVFLKNGKELKGLVVEEHADRIVLSTENGEIPLRLSGIRDIEYGELEQNLMKIGRSYEEAGKLGEALAYYEKALETNPGFEEARVAAASVRSRFWARATEGPRGEMETQQVIYDSWGSGKPIEQVIARRTAAQILALQESLGMMLEKKGDWVRIASVDAGKEAARAGLKKNDRLVSVDGRSLRYLPLEAVRRHLLEPRFSNFTLEYERDCRVHLQGAVSDLRSLGFKLKLEDEGLKVRGVEPESPAAEAGLKEEDFLTQVSGQATRYLPLDRLVELIRLVRSDTLVFTVRRSALLTRR